MDTKSFVAEKRTQLGKYTARKLRKALQIPAVMYGPDLKKSVALSVDRLAFGKLHDTMGMHQSFALSVDGQTVEAIIKDYRIDPLTRHYTHADFYVISPKQSYTAWVPLKYVGTPIGVREGGNGITAYSKLKVRALHANMPSEIVVDISAVQRKKFCTVSEVPVVGDYVIETHKGVVIYEVR